MQHSREPNALSAVDFPADLTVKFENERAIGAGADRALYAVIDFSAASDWPRELPEHRGRFRVPPDIADATGLSPEHIIVNPASLNEHLSAPWSIGFLVELEQDRWLLVVQTQ